MGHTARGFSVDLGDALSTQAAHAGDNHLGRAATLVDKLRACAIVNLEPESAGRTVDEPACMLLAEIPNLDSMESLPGKPGPVSFRQLAYAGRCHHIGRAAFLENGQRIVQLFQTLSVEVVGQIIKEEHNASMRLFEYLPCILFHYLPHCAVSLCFIKPSPVFFYFHHINHPPRSFSVFPEGVLRSKTAYISLKNPETFGCVLHAAQLTRDALRNMGQPIAAAEILILGAAYREDVGDTRYSGSEIVIRKLAEMGAEIRVHDPYVEHWWEFEQQDTYPGEGHSKARFFRNQEKLTELRIDQHLNNSLKEGFYHE